MADAMQAKPGEACWFEVNTPDAAGAKEFYSKLFGWTTSEEDMGTFKYTMFHHNGKGFGGIIPMTGPEWQGVPPHWMVYFTVDDVDATAKKITDLGGKVCVPPTDIHVGRFAIVSDPAGAYFSIFKGK